MKKISHIYQSTRSANTPKNQTWWVSLWLAPGESRNTQNANSPFRRARLSRRLPTGRRYAKTIFRRRGLPACQQRWRDGPLRVCGEYRYAKKRRVRSRLPSEPCPSASRLCLNASTTFETGPPELAGFSISFVYLVYLHP